MADGTETAEAEGFEWMMVEIFGHRSHWGKGKEVERFGSKMLRAAAIAYPTGRIAVFVPMMPSLFRVLACSSLIAATTSVAFADPPRSRAPAAPKQVVIISFDNARDIAQWKRSRALGQRTGAHFSYFLSCVFLLSKETRKDYVTPVMATP